jgi:hypothetical protein
MPHRHRERRPPTWLLGLVDLRRVWRPAHVVEVEEQHQGGPCRSLVAIDEGMVPGQSTRQDRSLVDEIGVELVTLEAGRRRVQGGVGQIQSRAFGEHGCSTPVTCSASHSHSASWMYRDQRYCEIPTCPVCERRPARRAHQHGRRSIWSVCVEGSTLRDRASAQSCTSWRTHRCGDHCPFTRSPGSGSRLSG